MQVNRRQMLAISAGAIAAAACSTQVSKQATPGVEPTVVRVDPVEEARKKAKAFIQAGVAKYPMAALWVSRVNEIPFLPTAVWSLLRAGEKDVHFADASLERALAALPQQPSLSQLNQLGYIAVARGQYHPALSQRSEVLESGFASLQNQNTQMLFALHLNQLLTERGMASGLEEINRKLRLQLASNRVPGGWGYEARSSNTERMKVQTENNALAVLTRMANANILTSSQRDGLYSEHPGEGVGTTTSWAWVAQAHRYAGEKISEEELARVLSLQTDDGGFKLNGEAPYSLLRPTAEVLAALS